MYPDNNNTTLNKRMMLHTTIYSSATSPCGQYCAVGNNYGHILIFDLKSALKNNGVMDQSKRPISVFQAHDGAVFSLLTVENHLISAGSGAITLWSWEQVVQNNCTRLSHLVTEDASTNCITYSAKEKVLYSGGCGNTVTAWDIKTSKAVGTLSGHSDYIHDVAAVPNGVASASEDGCVKIWDSRSATCTSTIQPGEEKTLSRPECGKWLSCITADADGEWIICGGGPQLSLWHNRSGSLVKPMETKLPPAECSDFLPNVVKIIDDEIVAGGNSPYMIRWQMNGDLKAAIPCSIQSIFSVSTQPTSSNTPLPLLVTGTDYKINVFTNMGYHGMTLSCI